MLKAATPESSKNPWPLEIQRWLADDEHHHDLDREMRDALARDPRLKRVAAKLALQPEVEELLTSLRYVVAKLRAQQDGKPPPNPTLPEPNDWWYAYPEGGLQRFLDVLLALPAKWKFFREHTRNGRAKALVQLHKVSDEYLRALTANDDLAGLYLAGWTVDSVDQIELGKRRLADLRLAVKTVRDFASAGQDLFAPGDYPDLGHKKSYSQPGRALRNYFVRELVRNAREIFGEPLHGEVALLATVCLKLEHELGPDEVRDIERSKARAALAKRPAKSKSPARRAIRRRPVR